MVLTRRYVFTVFPAPTQCLIVEMKAVQIEETDQLKDIDYIRKGLDELPVGFLLVASYPV